MCFGGNNLQKALGTGMARKAGQRTVSRNKRTKKAIDKATGVKSK